MSPQWNRKRKSSLNNEKIENNLCSTPYVVGNLNINNNMGTRSTSDNYIFQQNNSDVSYTSIDQPRPRSLPKPKINLINSVPIKSSSKRNITFNQNDGISRRISFNRTDFLHHPHTKQPSPSFYHSEQMLNTSISPSTSINTFPNLDSPTFMKNSVNFKKESTKLSYGSNSRESPKIYFRILNPFKMMILASRLVLSSISNPSNYDDGQRIIFLPENLSTVVSQHLILVGTLGQGTSGITRLYQDIETSKYFVLKEYYHLAKGDFDMAKLTKESAALFILNHINVVQYNDTLVNGTNYIIQLEYCNGLNLREIINKYEENYTLPNENKVKSLLIQLLNGLEAIHSKSVVHMDIKPENIITCIDLNYIPLDRKALYAESLSVIDPDNIIIKIADFGHCYLKTSINIEISEGDSRYISKEVLSNSYCEMISEDKIKVVNEPQPSIDVFALSLTIAEYCGCGHLPSQGPDWHEIRRGILPSIGSIYSNELIHLLTRMIHYDPKQRPTVTQCLQSDYLRQCNINPPPPSSSL